MSVVVRAVLVISILALCSCRRDMFQNGRIKPEEESHFFRNGSTAQRQPAHTLAQSQYSKDPLFDTGEENGRLASSFPMKITTELLNRGRERFNIYCSVCHGRTGEGNGMIVQRGFPKPPTFHQDRLRKAPPGYIFGVITHGYGVMYSYADRVQPADRWAIVAYIRALQLSQNARLEDVPLDRRGELK
jgi:cytochrome c553